MLVKGNNRQMYDQRILGNGDFVENILKDAEKKDEIESKMDIDELINRVGKYYDIEPYKIINKKNYLLRTAMITPTNVVTITIQPTTQTIQIPTVEVPPNQVGSLKTPSTIPKATTNETITPVNHARKFKRLEL